LKQVKLYIFGTDVIDRVLLVY